MVNYCCVEGCGRSSKLSPHLNYYTIPKDKQRRLQWLNAAGREDLAQNLSTKSTHRICSRHFNITCMKNKNLAPDAVPTLCLPSYDKGKNEAVPHHDIVCDSCKNTILGFRYKCVTCADYDLCPKCEMLEIHSNHYMLRIPKPLKFKIADDLIKKWRTFFKAEHVNPDCDDDDDGSICSSDDEPISKHITKQYDSGVDLADDVKEMIRGEVTRVLSLKTDRKKRKREKKKGDDAAPSKATGKAKKPKPDRVEGAAQTQTAGAPEVVFADVNEYKDQLDVKSELPATSAGDGDDTVFGQPMMNVRLSDDLTELMIEMTNGAGKTYKYN